MTHGLGILFAIAALAAMTVLAADDVLEMLTALVFGASLVALYTSSTLYHFFTSHGYGSYYKTYKIVYKLVT